MASYTALTVVGGTTITSAWGNNVRDSAIPTVTSSTRPSSPTLGMTIYETDTQAYQTCVATSPVTWTEVARSGNVPTINISLYQGAAVSFTAESYWARRGGWVEGEVWMQATASGTAGQQIFCVSESAPTLPLLNGKSGYAAGSFIFNNGTLYTGTVNMAVVSSQNRFFFYTNNTTNSLGASPAVTLASGNQLSFNFRYRVS